MIAKVPARGSSRLEWLGRIDPARTSGAGAAVVGKGAVPQILDALDIVLAASLNALFAAIKR